ECVVRSVNAWSGSESCRNRADSWIHRDCRRYIHTAGLATPIVVTVEAEVETGADDVRSMNERKVVDELRSKDLSLGSRRVVIWLLNGVEVDWGNIRKVGIGLALRKEEIELRKTNSKVVRDGRRNIPSVPDDKIRRTPEHLAQRRKVGEYLRAR